jgi:hypothetical protein
MLPSSGACARRGLSSWARQIVFQLLTGWEVFMHPARVTNAAAGGYQRDRFRSGVSG